MSCAFCLMCEWIIILFRRSSSLNLCAKGFWGQSEKKLISRAVKMFEAKIYVVCNQAAKAANGCTWTSAHIFLTLTTLLHALFSFRRETVFYSLSLFVWFFLFFLLFEQLKRSEKHKTLDGDQSGAHTYTLSLARSMRFRFLNWNRRARSTKQQLGGLSKLHCETKYGKHAQTRSIRNTALCVRTQSIP